MMEAIPKISEEDRQWVQQYSEDFLSNYVNGVPNITDLSNAFLMMYYWGVRIGVLSQDEKTENNNKRR